MSLGPDLNPLTLPVFVWLEVAARLADAGDGVLAELIQHAMHGHRLGDDAVFQVTADEQAQIERLVAELPY